MCQCVGGHTLACVFGRHEAVADLHRRLAARWLDSVGFGRRAPAGWTGRGLGDVFRALVKAAGGRRAAAAALGVTEGAIGHWQTGRNPIPWTVFRVATIQAVN